MSVGSFSEAVTRIGPEGAAPDPWMAAQAITIDEAIRLLTVDAAYGAFEEDSKGTLTPGAEVAPAYDVGEITALAASHLAMEMLYLYACR